MHFITVTFIYYRWPSEKPSGTNFGKPSHNHLFETSRAARHWSQRAARRHAMIPYERYEGMNGMSDTI